MKDIKDSQIAYFASGCFWGTEYYFMKAQGVVKTTVGFMGGSLQNPTYQQVKTGKSGHVEVVKVEYNPTQTTYENLLKLYYETHDFEQVGGQGPDIGEQYQSVIFYADEEQKQLAEKYIEILTGKAYQVATKLSPAATFWEAEDYHQQYYDKKQETPYCHVYRKLFYED